MKLFELVRKFGDGFKKGWNECQSDGKTEWQEDEMRDSLTQNPTHTENVSIFYDEIPNPNDTTHPNHSLYYGK